MNKTLRLFVIVLTLAMLVIVPSVLAQEADEAEFVEEVVLPVLEEYNDNLPERYGTINVEGFVERLAENEDLVILDVREVEELEENGTIDGAINVPLRTLGENLALLPDLDAEIVVLCKGGFRATIGMTALHVLGYENAHVLTGGFDAWVGEELPVVEAAVEAEAEDVPADIDEELLDYVAVYLAELPEGWGVVRPLDFFEETFEAMPDLLLDVRSEEEWNDPGYIEGATHIWIDEFMPNFDQVTDDLEADIVVYCASSYRAGVVTTMLGMLGYENVRNMAGGIQGWIAADLPLVTS